MAKPTDSSLDEDLPIGLSLALAQNDAYWSPNANTNRPAVKGNSFLDTVLNPAPSLLSSSSSSSSSEADSEDEKNIFKLEAEILAGVDDRNNWNELQGNLCSVVIVSDPIYYQPNSLLNQVCRALFVSWKMALSPWLIRL